MNIDTDAWFAVLAAARAHDRPDGPALERAAETGRLRIPSLHSRAVPVTLPAPEGATGYAGVALLRLHDTEENAGNAFLDTLTVHPARRGRGVGRALWETVCGRLAAEGRTSVSTLLERGGAGERFAGARGAECALPLVAYVQDVRTAPSRPRVSRCPPATASPPGAASSPTPMPPPTPAPMTPWRTPRPVTWTNSTTPGTPSGYGPRPGSSWTAAVCC